MSSSMSSSVVVKSSLGDDVRRFTLNQPFAYAQLISLLCGAYPNISSFSIKYRDEENDLVSITNDSELLDAIVASNKILRISVFSSSENGGKELNALGSTNASASASDGKSTESSDNNNNNNNNSHDAVTKKASSTSDGVEGGGVSSKKKRKEEKKKHKKQTIELSSSSSSSDSEEDAAVKTVVVKEKAPVDVHCPLGTSVHVYHEGDDVWDATLNQTSIGQNSNKFYVIQLLESDNARQYWCWYRWGRVGAAGQNALIACGPSLDRAKQEFQQKFLDKTKNAWANRKNFETFRGKYTLLEMDYGGVNKEQEKASSSVSSSSSSSSSSVVSVPTPIPAPVKESSSSSSSFSSSSDSDVELNVPTNDTITIHTNIICNMCNMNPIIGIRYKCSVCEDFDLCSNCEALNAHPPNHALIKLRSSSSSSSILKKRYARMIYGHSHPHSHSHHHHHHPHPFHRVGGCLAKHWQHQADKQRQRDEEEEKAIQKRKEEKIAEKLARKAEKERLKQEKKQAREEKKQMKEKKKREEEEEEEEEGHLKFVFSAPPPKASAPASPAPIDTATAAPVPVPAPAVVSETVIADSAPIAAVASPSVPPPPPSYRPHKYETQLQALSSMGFSNRELNIYMLEKSNGNLQECANWLLEHLM